MQREETGQVTVFTVEYWQHCYRHQRHCPGHLDTAELSDKGPRSRQKTDDCHRQHQGQENRPEPISPSSGQGGKIQNRLVDQRPDLAIERQGDSYPVTPADKRSEPLTERGTDRAKGMAAEAAIQEIAITEGDAVPGSVSIAGMLP